MREAFWKPLSMNCDQLRLATGRFDFLLGRRRKAMSLDRQWARQRTFAENFDPPVFAGDQAMRRQVFRADLACLSSERLELT